MKSSQLITNKRIILQLINHIPIILFFIISLLLLINHEPAFSIAQPWMIARDSPDFISMLKLSGYEGTPMLWHVFVFGLVKLGLPYISIQIFSFLIVFLSVLLFYYFSPFKKINKILFIFGYFIIYEYNTLTRSYGLSVLILFLIALNYKNRLNKKYIHIILLTLLGNTNLHSLAIMISLLIVYFYECLNLKKEILSNSILFIISVFIIIIPLYQVLPFNDSSFTIKKTDIDITIEHLAIVPHSFIYAFIPIPELTVQFWNTKLIDNHLKYLSIIGTIMFFLIILQLKKVPSIIYIIFSIEIYSMYILKPFAGWYMRHYGFAFILWIFCLWISSFYRNESLFFKYNKLSIIIRRNFKYLFVLILIFQLTAGLVAIIYEIKYNFSNAKDAAIFLEKYLKITENNSIIAAYRSINTVSIIPNLAIQRPFYCLEYDKYCTYMIINNIISDNISIEKLQKFELKEPTKRHYFITTKPLDYSNIIEDFNLTEKYVLIKSFNNDLIFPDEDYLIYEKI